MFKDIHHLFMFIYDKPSEFSYNQNNSEREFLTILRGSNFLRQAQAHSLNFRQWELYTLRPKCLE